MVKPEFAFLQMKIKSVFLQSPKANKSGFGKSPKAFNTVDVRKSVGKLILIVLNAEMLLVAQIHKAIVAAPAVGMDNAFKFHAASL